MKIHGLVLLSLVVAMSCSGADYTVRESKSYEDEKTGLTILSGEVVLPTAGDWRLKASPGVVDGIADVTLFPPEEVFELRKGRRFRQMEETRERESGRRVLRRLYWGARRYAARHDGFGPAKLDVPDARFRLKAEERSTCHYIPNVRLLRREGTNRWVNAEPSLLAFEIKPVVDDGKHWVLWSDGSVRLEDIEPNRLAEHEAELVPGRKPVQEQMSETPDSLAYRVFARRHDGADGEAERILVDEDSGREHVLRWAYGDARPATGELLKDWGQLRIVHWAAMDRSEGASVLTYWIAAASKQYGIGKPRLPAQRDRRRNRGQSTTLFNVLSGRAAVRETLQLEAIATGEGDTARRTVPVDSIPGVTVTSHPFEAMLDGATGTRLELAECVPTDRFFAYFAKPEALLQLMDGGAEFIFHGGTTVTGRSIEYGLVQRTMAELGLTETWTRNLLRSGAVGEMAVLLPDLFLVDGTDLTVISRLKNPLLVAAALKVLGLGNLGQIVSIDTKSGGSAFWVQRGDLLLLSTREDELRRVLALIEDPKDSLGASAEFRYMLSRQPLDAHTRAYFYFSDPFIRRLVGPAVKIGQFRRLRARVELEALTAGRLLYAADGHTAAVTVEELVNRGYAPNPVLVTDAAFDADGIVRSATYGSLPHLRTLLAVPVAGATPAEATAYRAYVDNYSRYWRRFFDPIGIRFDQPGDREMELSVFILPLIDNSLYQGARSVLIPGEDQHPLSLPRLDPEPVAMLSLNLNEQSWVKAAEGLDDMLRDTLGIRADILDHLGPDVHIALGDADPIINIGSGELAGLAGVTGGFGNDMFAIPVLVSMLTRPCVLAIGLNDPRAVREKLRRMPTGQVSGRALMGTGRGSLYRLTGRDVWHYVVSIEGLLSLRFGLEVKDRYLVISNLPLSHDPDIRSWEEAEHNAAALTLSPAACLEQLPALYTSASERQRDAAMAGLGSVYPLLRAGASNIGTARARHRRLFGFAPSHPGRGNWVWEDGRLSSTVFGSPGREEQPEYRPKDASHGVLRGIERVRLSMQFEDDGLRTRCRWTLAE